MTGEAAAPAAAAADLTTALLAVDDPRWQQFVEGRPEATSFHHPAWCGVLEATYGYRPFALCLQRADGALQAGLPLMEVRGLRGRRWLSLPFTDACPPLADAELEAPLVDALDRERGEAGIGRVEVRGSLASPHARSEIRGLVHVLRLGADANVLLSTFSRSQVQRNIARATREGVTVRRGERRVDLVETFYRLHLATRRRQGVPIQPRKFFAQLWERMLEPGLGFVLVAEAGGRPAAAAVFLGWNRTLTYKFGASDPASWPLRPNHLLFWEAIRLGCDHGYDALDFGRTDHSNEGLRAFKRGWGTSEADLVYSTLGNPGSTATDGSGRAAALLGAVIRRSPLWVCRLAGETLYRHAA